MSVFDEPKVDCHCHILDPAAFPYADDVAYRPAGQEVGTLAQYRQVMDAYGIGHALLVGPNSGYNQDNTCMLDAIAGSGGRFKGIAVVPNDIDRPRLEQLGRQGVIGVAWNASLLGVAHYAQAEGLLRLLAGLDMVLSLQVQDDQLLELGPMVQRSGVRVLVDHCGRPAAGGGLDQPGFQALLRLAATGRAAVKLSGFQKFSNAAPPYDDAMPFVRALIDAYTLDACLWATDWPFLKAPQRLDVGPLLRAVERLLPNPADRRRLFQDAPRKWLGFSREDGSKGR